MDKLKLLQIKKLLKELDFIEINYEYTNEIIKEADTSFIENINEFLDRNPELKERYNKKIEETIEKNIKKNVEKSEKSKKVNEESESESESEKKLEEEKDKENLVQIEKKEPSKKVKKLYREIVKLTHPDKINDLVLNELYIKATEYYNNIDKMGIYKICNDLNIFYEIDEEDDILIKEKIDFYKNKIKFMESTYTWKWLNTENEIEKNLILMSFIKMKIN